MHGKLVRRAARGVAISAILAAGLGSAQVAQAAPAVVHVPCNPAALAAAVAAAGDGATLSLAPACVYHLTAGLPVVSQDLTITGNRATLERSHAPGTPAFTILQADAGALTVSKLNFRNGSGAIAIARMATLTVNGGTFAGNTADNGGAIFDLSGGNGPLVTGATFIANTATESGGAIFDLSGRDGPQVTGATFIANTATESGGAIFDNTGGGGVQVTDSTFTANSAGNAGGAISDFDGLRDAVTGSVFYGNTAATGGALLVNPSAVTTLSDVVVRDNSATGDGGGIASADGLVLENSRISGNHAGGRGGGLFTFIVKRMTIADTDFRDNSAADGGGIYNSSTAAPMELTNVRISGNHVTANGGGVYNLGSVFAVNIRIVRNSAATGGGGIYEGATTAEFTLTNSQVLRNRPDNCEPAGSITGCTG